MPQATGIVAALGIIMVVYYFILGRREGFGRVLDRGGHPVSNASFGGSFAAFFEGLIAVLALSELSAVGGTRGGSFAGGALIGFVAAVGLFARQWWPGRLGYELFYSVLGLAASVPAITHLFEASDCDVGVNPAIRIVAVVIMVVMWAGALIAAVAVRAAGGWRARSSGLALFGALDVILFMSGPIGTSISPSGAAGIVLLVGVIGGLSGFAPNLVMMTAGAFLGAIQFLTATTGLRTECNALVSTTPMSMLAGFALVFWLGAWLYSKRRLGRA